MNATDETKSVTVENDSSSRGVIKTFNAAGSTALTSVGASTNGGEIKVNATDDTVSVKITNDGSKRGKLEVYNAAGSTALTTIEADSSDNGKLTQKTSAGAVVNQVSADASTDTYFNSGPVGLGTSEPSAGYAVDVKGTAKVFSSSTPADGLIQLGTATNQTMGVVGGSSNFVYGAGMSSFSSDSDETLDVFTTNSAGYSAIDAYIIGSSPATGSAIMAGSGNSISGHFNVIVAGAKNLISGGTQNFIGGGTGVDIIASTYSVNVGGEDNDIVSGIRTVIAGGFRNKITGAHSANIGGGSENVIEKGNYKSIGGGFQNVISGNSSSSAIAGGLQNKIIGDSANYSFIGAGGSNTIKGNSQGSTIAGGVGCIISNSSASFAGGGNSIIISGSDAVALGNYSHVQQGHDGAFVFTDANTTPVLSTGKNTMVMKFESGVFIETTSGLYVNGNAVLTGETPEGDTLQTVTTRGDTTTTNIISEKIVSGVTGLFGDRVGIGNVNPQDFSSAANRLVVGDGVGHQGMSIFAGTSSSAGLYFADGAAGSAAYQGFIDYRHNNSDMRFGAAGGTRMVMNGNGLLIFPNGGPPFSPSAELEIASSVPTIRLTDSDLTNTFSEIEKGGDYLYFYSRANSSNGGFLFAGDNGTTETEFLRIDTAGQVGIGSNTPSAKLDVAGGIKLLDNNYLSWNSSNTRIVGNSDYLQVQVSASDKVRVTSSGVGIGTTGPESKVHIYGGDSTETFSNINAGLAVENNGSSASHYVFQTATAGGGKSFSITNAGRVGIGTTNPNLVTHIYFTGNNGLRVESTQNHSNIDVRSHNSYGAYLRFMDGNSRYWLQARVDDKL